MFRQAFKGVLTLRTTTSPGNLAAAVSNTVMESGVVIKLKPTSRITDNDWKIRCTSLKHYSLFEQARSPLEERLWNKSNSTKSKKTGQEGMGWTVRSGYGLGLPYDWMGINN